MVLNSIKSVAQDFCSLIFMDLCICCYEMEPVQNQAFCLACLSQIPYIDKQSSISSLLIGKKVVPYEVIKFYSLLTYPKSGKVKELLHQMKYCNRPMIATKLGQQLAKRISETGDMQNYIQIPVPLHPQRRKKRGYNQAVKIAEGIKKELDISINYQVLQRIQNNESQTMKGADEREEVQDQRFALMNNISIDPEKHALIIDDIVTTGSTIAACYHLLKQAGYQKISVATLAITI